MIDSVDKIIKASLSIPNKSEVFLLLLTSLFIAVLVESALTIHKKNGIDNPSSGRRSIISFIFGGILIFIIAFLQVFSNLSINIASNRVYDSINWSEGMGEKEAGEYLDEPSNPSISSNHISESEAKLTPGWGNNEKPREAYTISEINEGVLGDRIVFNSITDSVIGNEFAFVGIREDTGIQSSEYKWYNEIVVEEGKEYVVRLYVHNNNPKGLNAIAKDTTLHFTMPMYSGKEVSLQGSIDSSNSIPSRYWYQVVFKSDREFYLDYIEGSAFYENNGIGAGGEGGIQLSDDIITSKGVLIGYDDLDGNIPGCYKYDSYTRIKVRPVFVDAEEN